MLTALPFLLLAAATRVDDHYTPAFEACLASGAAAQTQTAAQVACDRDELARQDRLLNAAYRDVMNRRSGAEQAELRREERAWIAQRDRICGAAYRQEGGTIDQVLGADCVLAETTKRRIYLENLDH